MLQSPGQSIVAKVKNRVAALIGEKQARENKVVSASDVARATGLTRQTLSLWVNNAITSYRAETLAALCTYFNCSIDELLYIDTDDSSQ